VVKKVGEVPVRLVVEWCLMWSCVALV
jgi:hypothetical protein